MTILPWVMMGGQANRHQEYGISVPLFLLKRVLAKGNFPKKFLKIPQAGAS